MIDWITCRVRMAHKPDGGRIVAVDADGQVEWVTEQRISVRGSWDTTVCVRTMHDGSVEFSGSPAKFLQGHNVFGSNDLAGLCVAMVLRACQAAGLTLSLDELTALREGRIGLHRVDVTESWDLGTRKRAIAAVQALAELGHLKQRGRGSLIGGSTVMFGPASRRSSLKGYAKGPELDVHKMPADLPGRDAVRAFAEGLVRMEYQLRRMELKRLLLDSVSYWQPLGNSAELLHTTVMENLKISETDLPETLDVVLPPRYQAVYQAWHDGNDVRPFFQSRATYYRYRDAILSATGCDIAVKRPKAGPDLSNVHRLKILLVAKPVGVPDWARGTSLYFDPAATPEAA